MEAEHWSLGPWDDHLPLETGGSVHFHDSIRVCKSSAFIEIDFLCTSSSALTEAPNKNYTTSDSLACLTKCSIQPTTLLL